MLVFYEYTKAEMLAYLKEQVPHAEIHVQDEVSQKHAANGPKWQATYSLTWS